MKIGLTSDIHLDCVTIDEKKRNKIVRVGRNLTEHCDLLLIAGDVTTSYHTKWHMEAFEEGASCPYYWVAGNHDYWGSSFDEADKVMSKMKGYVSEKIVKINDETCLIGINGWFDGRSGDYNDVWDTNDHLKIKDLHQVLYMSRRLSLEKIRERTDAQAKIANNLMEEAVKEYKKIFILTHYPPWPNEDDDSHFYAWSVNTELGKKIIKVSANNPKVQFEVIAGHTHQQWEALISDNVNIKTQLATYSQPVTRSYIKFDS